MKTTLLFALGLFSLVGYSQHQISQYMGFVLPEPVDDGNSRTYWTFSSETPLNQASAGADMSWNFNLSELGQHFYHNTSPTAEELEAYPNSSNVTTISNPDTGETIGKAYALEGNASFALTGFTSNGLTLNYSTDECIIGHFPMNYGYSNTDTVGGTYNYGDYSGNFTGTITSTVDAYGLLSITLPSDEEQPNAVTRLKTVQTVTLSYSFFPNVGTVTQTTYHYYGAFNTFPLFKSTTTHIAVPLLSIDQTDEILEASGTIILLSNQNFSNQSTISIAPNPVTDQLFIQKSTSEKIHSLNISDISGKAILNFNNPENTLNISQLQKGVYFAQIKTDSGTFTKKIIKK